MGLGVAMQQSGEYRIGARAEAVWRALNDPEVLSQCIDGCESLTASGPDAFAAVVKAKIGPLSAIFTGEVRLADLNPPTSYTLMVSAKGGAAGFGKGTARVSLTEESDGTLLRYEVEGNVGGKLAQVGQRLIDGAARKMADDFFAKFGEILVPAPVAEVAPAPATNEPEGKRRPGWLPVALIVGGTIIMALIALLMNR
jgi:carbon monoxide dehydrogenase subunit G